MKVKYNSEIRCDIVPAPAPSRALDAKEIQVSFRHSYGVRQNEDPRFYHAVYLSPAQLRCHIATLQKELAKFPEPKRRSKKCQ